jgi:hypothetical protein
MSLNVSKPFDISRLQVTPHRFSFTTDSVDIDVDWKAVHDDLGFRKPDSFRQKYVNYSQQKASQGISSIVSAGDMYLRQPQRAAISLAKQAGRYQVQTTLANRPSVAPSVSVTKAEPVRVNFEPGDVSMSASPYAEIDPQYTKPQIRLNPKPDVQISVIPWNIPGAKVDRTV